MKKVLAKDKKLRLSLKQTEKRQFILKSIFKNLNFFNLLRWKASVKLDCITKTHAAKVSLSNRCVYTINKKRLNKYTTFSRHIFLKLIRSGKISGVQKSCW